MRITINSLSLEGLSVDIEGIYIDDYNGIANMLRLIQRISDEKKVTLTELQQMKLLDTQTRYKLFLNNHELINTLLNEVQNWQMSDPDKNDMSMLRQRFEIVFKGEYHEFKNN